jgi:predicted amidohydrolase YtcJ
MKTPLVIRFPLALALLLPFYSSLSAAPEKEDERAQPRIEADQIFFNGKVITIDAARGRHEEEHHGFRDDDDGDGGHNSPGNGKIVRAFAVRDGRFIAVGSNGEVMRHKGRGTQLVNLRGRTVIPGLADGHFHSIGGGPGMDLSKTRSLADLFAVVAKAAQAAAPGQILVSNSDWHEAQLAEQRLPLASELDISAPNNPVVLVRGGHSYILNNVALRLFNITTQTPVPSGGAIPRTPEGQLTGELIDNAKALATLPPSPPQTPEQIRQALLDTQARMNSYGVVAVRNAASSVTAYRQWQALRNEGAITLRNAFLIGMFGGSATTVTNFVANSGVRAGEGDAWLRIVGLKFGVDGGFEGGFMREPYKEPYGLGGTYRGLQTTSAERYYGALRAAALSGWRVATHAVGDAAVDFVLEGYRQAYEATPFGKYDWVIEHAFVAEPEHFPKIRALGLALSVQDHLFLAAPSLKRMWGEERAARVTPVRTYLDQGFLLVGGTDTPVVPKNPWWAMYHFITRDTISDGVYGPEERVLNREDVLRIFTLNYAKLIHEKHTKGSIAPGKLADFVIASGDFLTVPERELHNLTALATYVGGKRVYLAPDLQPDDF